MNLRLWGGRFNPIVPVFNNNLKPGWKGLLQFQDPDYVYFSKQVNKQFIIDICDEIGLNPANIIELDDQLNDIAGVHWVNMLPIISRRSLLVPQRLWEVNSPLIDYYKLNFLVEEDTPLQTGLYSKHQLTQINPETFAHINQILAQSYGSNNTLFSEINTTDTKLRPLNPEFHNFELVIAADDDQGFDELIYHWNKSLFDVTHRNAQTLFLKAKELSLLIADNDFKLVLKNMSLEHMGISLVSFSLDQAALQSFADALQVYSGLNRFEVKVVDDFPYAIRDRQGLNHHQFLEKEHVQVVRQGQPFVFLPPLSFFLDYKPFLQNYGFELKITEVQSPFYKTLKFPLKFLSDGYVQNQSRIDRKRDIFVVLTEPRYNSGKFNLTIPEFYNVIQQVVVAPKPTGSSNLNNIYRRVNYSDGSYKLEQFMKLFKDDFILLGEFLNDKFWNDLFADLTGNIKVEGDTITFEEIYRRCYSVLLEIGTEFKSKDESRINQENLRLGLKSTMQLLTESKIFLAGFIIKCRYCSSAIWYSLNDIKTIIVCTGCSNQNHFSTETPISYKLNHLVKNNIGHINDRGKFAPDGNLTAIKTILYLWNIAVNSFQYIPQIDIYDCSESYLPKTDLDIVAISAGNLYIGECKHSSELFFSDKKKCLDNLIVLAETMKPDKIILSCTIDNHDKLKKSVDYLVQTMRKWKNKPHVVGYRVKEPTYFGDNNHRYFLH